MGKVRRKNWFTAMGVLFIVVASIAIIRDLLIWGPEFTTDFFTSSDITSEKISVGMFGIAGFLIILGLRGENYEE
ncbi:hypothetical protein DYY66_0297 [Candidatus Nitrosotalea sp. FS]|uniref:hypothetical protein n=1 Tax=Candidatus Nitrosotalea sp. FS TaxID=2341021 RepID=UPI00140C82E2|nr:hypothetical protein [Candidatus Nitrosotalea sp. FS]NHH98600.1 hypothetical protein [Candidatus Nitrosotalea sp. FS]